MHPSRRRSIRGSLAAIVLAIMSLVIPGAAASGAVEIPPSSGTPGDWSYTDRASEPGAECSYEGGGAAGSVYLTGIRMLHDLEVFGLHDDLRSVGYRPLIQHLRDGHWSTVKKGILVTGQATAESAAVLPARLTKVPVVTDPNRFRLILRLIWYRADASVEARTTVLVQSYARYSAGVGSTCKGRIILV
jgi:hypothetical protein